MVALNFKARFADDVLVGRKLQTIRMDGKRRAPRVGEMLQLYTGMRSKACRLLRTSTCVSIERVHLRLTTGWIIVENRAAIILPEALNRFAQADGFADWNDMASFFKRVTNERGVVEGNLIKWALQ